jgi:3-methylfumaryl-CoA hydratase
MGVPGVDGRSMAAGNSFELFAPVRVGDVLTARERVLSLEQKTGRSGPLVFTETETQYTNQDGTLVARYRQTVVFR